MLLRKRVLQRPSVCWLFSTAALAALLLVAAQLYLSFERLPPWIQLRQWAVKTLVMPVRQSARESSKARLPRFAPQRTAGQPPILVPSLEQEVARRKHIQQALAAHNMSFEFVNAVDARQVLAAPLNRTLLEHYFHGPRLDRITRGCASGCSRDRAKMATDLTYLQLLRRVAASEADLVFIMEDDAELSLDFKLKLDRFLAELPGDVDLASLGPIFPQPGALVGAGVRVLRDGTGTMCILLRPAVARFVLELAPQALPHMYIDLFMVGLLSGTGQVNAYYADPPLCFHGRFPTTIQR